MALRERAEEDGIDKKQVPEKLKSKQAVQGVENQVSTMKGQRVPGSTASS
jgi:hypothetical protein